MHIKYLTYVDYYNSHVAYVLGYMFIYSEFSHLIISLIIRGFFFICSNR